METCGPAIDPEHPRFPMCYGREFCAQSNGFVEHLHTTLLDEHFRVLGRTKFYESIQEMQTDFDAYLVTYNTKRPHQGRGMNGRTPAVVFARCPAENQETKGGQSGKSRLEYHTAGAAGVR